MIEGSQVGRQKKLFTISSTNWRRIRPNLRASFWRTCVTRPALTGRHSTRRPLRRSTTASPTSPRGGSSRWMNTTANAGCELSHQYLSRSRKNSRQTGSSHGASHSRTIRSTWRRPFRFASLSSIDRAWGVRKSRVGGWRDVRRGGLVVLAHALQNARVHKAGYQLTIRVLNDPRQT